MLPLKKKKEERKKERKEKANIFIYVVQVFSFGVAFPSSVELFFLFFETKQINVEN